MLHPVRAKAFGCLIEMLERYDTSVKTTSLVVKRRCTPRSFQQGKPLRYYDRCYTNTVCLWNTYACLSGSLQKQRQPHMLFTKTLWGNAQAEAAAALAFALAFFLGAAFGLICPLTVLASFLKATISFVNALRPNQEIKWFKGNSETVLRREQMTGEETHDESHIQFSLHNWNLVAVVRVAWSSALSPAKLVTASCLDACTRKEDAWRSFWRAAL